MYSTDWCGGCKRAKRFFNENYVAYNEINIERSDEALGQLVKLTGGKHIVPTFDIEGKILINPLIKDLAAALNVPY